MTDYVLDQEHEHEPISLKVVVEHVSLNQRIPMLGYLSSTFPEFIISRDGVPTQGTVEIRLRQGSSPEYRSLLVKRVTSSMTGEWYVDNLNPLFKYDVICQLEGFNDIVYTDITPLT